MNASIRSSLVLATSCASLLILGIAGVLLQRSVEAELLVRFDRALLDEARLVSRLVEVEVHSPQRERDDDDHDEHEGDDDHERDGDHDDDDHDDHKHDGDRGGERDDERDDARRRAAKTRRLVIDVEFADLDMPAFGSGGEAFLELRAEGGVLYRSPSLGGAGLSQPVGSAEGVWLTLEDGRRVRGLGFSFEPRRERPGAGRVPPVQLVLARRADELEAALSVFTTRLIGVGALALGALALGLVLAVRFALRPLDALSRRIAEVRREDERIELPAAPAELVPLVLRTNELLARLGEVVARERAFSGEVAHELRTPLAGLRTTLEVLLRRPRAADEYREALDEVLTQLESLGGLVDKLLQLGRLEAGQVALELRSIDLADALLEGWEPFEARARERELRVEWALGEGLSDEADPNLLALALRNLLENATEYAELGGKIWIRSERVGARVEVVIENSGSRLDPTEVTLARQRFWRGSHARSEAGRHCGLGLALVDHAAESLRGALYLRATPEGRFEARLALPSA